MAPTRPDSTESLDAALRRLGTSEDDFVASRTLVANSIVASLIRDATVKGGSAMKFRYGQRATRRTSDLDVNRWAGPDEFSRALGEALEAGWEGFTGELTETRRTFENGAPEDTPVQYIDVCLSYLGTPWHTLPLESSRYEYPDGDVPDLLAPSDANELLAEMGFPELGPVAVLKVDHQVAQKLHGASMTGQGRTNDLIDLQIIVSHTNLDLPRVRHVCEHLFTMRKDFEEEPGSRQAWPPVIIGRERAGTRPMPSSWCQASSLPPTRPSHGQTSW